MFVELTPEQQRIIGLAKELAKEFAPRAEQHDREGSFPFENIARLKETGYTAMTTPKEYGGWGVDPFTFILAQEQLVQGCCATAFAINMHCNYGGLLYAVHDRGAEGAVPGKRRPQKDADERILHRGRRRALDPLAQHQGAQGARRLSCSTARRSFARSRRWSTTSVSALRSKTTRDRSSGGCVFLLPRDAPGLEVIENWDAMGMRATGSHTIMIRDVFATPDQLIGEEGHFFEEFVKVAHWYCLSFSAVYVGIGQAAYNYVLEYARTRKLQKTGQLVGSLPATRFALGEMYNRLEACRTLIYSLAREMSEGRTYGERQVMTIETLRTFVAENMLEVANLATRIAGGQGYLKGNPLERYFRDLRSAPLHTLKRDEVLEMIAATELGFA